MKKPFDVSIIWRLRLIPFDAVLSFYNIPIPKHYGKDYKICCPFHDEKTPSFTVNPDKNLAYCFGCSTGYDPIKFIRTKEGCRFTSALSILADIGGYKLLAELLKEISQSFGGVWGDADKVKEVYEARQREIWAKLTSSISCQVIKMYQASPYWRRHFSDIEWVWLEFDDITKSDMTMELFDLLKDWLRKTKRYVKVRIELWRELEVLKRKWYEERIGKI